MKKARPTEKERKESKGRDGEVPKVGGVTMDP